MKEKIKQYPIIATHIVFFALFLIAGIILKVLLEDSFDGRTKWLFMIISQLILYAVLAVLAFRQARKTDGAKRIAYFLYFAVTLSSACVVLFGLYSTFYPTFLSAFIQNAYR